MRALPKICGFPTSEEVTREDMYLEASRIWWNVLTSKDWLQAFKAHPRIGDKEALRKKFKKSKVVWESGEQAGAANASEKTLADLKDANELYERRYGFIFLVCATGKVFVFLYFSFS